MRRVYLAKKYLVVGGTRRLRPVLELLRAFVD
jgi:hypothetical protein